VSDRAPAELILFDLSKQVLRLFRSGLDTMDIIAWFGIKGFGRYSEAQVVRALHLAIEAERKAAEAA
jgi:hypothetical protein